MPRAKESLKIEVAQSTDADLRIVTVTITAPAKDFMLPDLLSDRGVIEAFDVALKRTVREVTEEYLVGTENLVATLADQKQEPKGEEPRPKPKVNSGQKGRSAGPKREGIAAEDSLIRSSQEPVPGDVTASIAVN